MRWAFSQLRLQAQRQRGDGAQGEPGLHGAKDAAHQGAPLVELLAELQVARGDVAEDDVGVAGHGLGVGGDGEVGTEGERALAERRGGGVVDGDERAGRVGALTEQRDVGDLHGGVGGGLDPEQLRAFEVVALGVVGGGGEAQFDAHLLEIALQELAGGEVGIVGEDDGVAGAEEGAEDGGAGSHAGGEDQRVGAIGFAGVCDAGSEDAGLELGDGALKRGPCGVVGAGVAVGRFVGVAGGVVGRGEDGAGVERLAGGGAGEVGADGFGGVMHRFQC